ncbi:MAG: beta galactosidase jelly roll domain-containing protein [Treponema sp.]|jgi:beta-glucuronidase|nr:beta galactosidase jelly roll domain-containing protein [Treponema sp.]
MAAGNYQADIHNNDYEAEYRAKKLDARGLVNIDGRKLESLNGRWNFAPDLYDSCRRARWWSACQKTEKKAPGMNKPEDWDFEAWETMPVPSCWNMEKNEYLYFEASGIYTRTFNYYAQKKDERAFLFFEGASYAASVFLNGEYLGSHWGASTPFCVEISGSVQEFNRIIVTVDARRSPLRIPTDNTDWFNYGGLYRDVYLLRTGPAFIKDWFIRLVNGVEIRADISIEGGTAGLELEIPELNIREKLPVLDGKASLRLKASPHLWSPENPKLYDFTLKLAEGDAEDDSGGRIKDRIGFREICTRGEEIFLNGKKIFLKGICVHEDHFKLGKTTGEETIRETIRDLRELKGNYLRLAHYPHDRRFSRIASEEGVLLWEEVPVYWAVAFDNSETREDAENQLAELVIRDRNQAGVIIWSVGNENADTDSRLTFMSGLAKKARSLDDSRLISAACLINHEKLMIQDRLGEHLDIIGINEYYGWYDPDFEKLPKILNNSKPGKPVVICEFGAGARLGQRGTVDDLFTEDMQKRIYEQQTETFKTCAYIAGTSPWILYDFRCPRRLNRCQEGFNRKGLIDADRKSRKAAFYVMRKFYEDM